MWHSPQPLPLKIGPSPSAVVSGPVNSSTAASKLHSSCRNLRRVGRLVRQRRLVRAELFGEPVVFDSESRRSFGGSALRLCRLVEPEHDQDCDGPHTRYPDDLESSHLHLPESRLHSARKPCYLQMKGVKEGERRRTRSLRWRLPSRWQAAHRMAVGSLFLGRSAASEACFPRTGADGGARVPRPRRTRAPTASACTKGRIAADRRQSPD